MPERFFLLKGAHVFDGIDRLVDVVSDGIQLADTCLKGIELSELHKNLPLANVNSVRITAFKHLNAMVGQHDLLLNEIAGDALRMILGPDLLVQTKLNLSIQLPGDKNSQLDLHSDCWSGDTPFQVNLWIPLTSCFSTNSMFLLSEEDSFRCISLVNENPTLERSMLWSFVDDDDFIELPKGEAIIFNPGLIHGNLLNETDKTRVSINVRFKGLFSPDASPEHVSRSVGPYYRKFQVSDWTSLAQRLQMANSGLLFDQ